MDARRFQRLNDLFELARNVPPDRRHQLLVEQTGDEPALVDEVLALLARHADGDSRFLARAKAGIADLAGDLEADPLPEQIGPYRILGKLGEGGMGTVYLAEQSEPVRRQVALKLIRPGLDSAAVTKRFEREQQALALMQHDGIAKVFDCGISDRGQPFFVMELVEGVPLTEFCEQHELSLRDRLLLMQQVCAAVTHAHQKGVVHRDLKPSNVLVSDGGGRPSVKIIDFGLAKAMEPQLAKTLFTASGTMLGTPEYMAPEQADPGNPDIDTRADVYSIGVMLYQVLVGRLPFPSEQLRGAGWIEMQRVLREVEPPRPSQELSTGRTSASAVPKVRGMSTTALARALRDDLDWVVLKAIDKDRDRRYGTASALADDLQRFLDSQPLVAGPPSARYRLRKFVRRHRTQIAAVTAVVLASVTFGGVAFVQYDRAEEAATEASRRAKDLTQVSAFQRSQLAGIDVELMGERLQRALLAASRPENRDSLTAGLGGVTFTDLALGMLWENVLHRGLAAIENDLGRQPTVKAELLQVAASTLQELGLLDRATAPQMETLEIRRRTLPEDHPQTLGSIHEVGRLLMAQGKLAEAEPYLRDALARMRRTLGDDHPDTLLAMSNLGTLLQGKGRLAEAETLIGAVLAGMRVALGEDHAYALDAIADMGSLLKSQGKLREAEPFCRDALERRRRILGEAHSHTLASKTAMASLLEAQGHGQEAESLLRGAVEGCRAAHGSEHPRTIRALAGLGSLLRSQGKLSEAEAACDEVLATSRRVLGDNHHITIAALSDMAMVHEAHGNLVEAESLMRHAWGTSRRVLGQEQSLTLTCLGNLSRMLKAQDKFAEAESMCREALATMRRALGEEHPHTLSAVADLGSLLSKVGKFAEAEPFCRDAVAKMRCLLDEDHPHTQIAISNLGLLLSKQGRVEEAAPFLLETVAKMRKHDALHPDMLAALLNVGGLLKAQGKLAEAEPLHREVLARMRPIHGNEQRTVTAINNLGSLLQARGNYEEAEVLYREALMICRRELTNEHHLTLVAMGNLGGLLQDQGKLAEAEPLCRTALETMRRNRGDQDPATLISFRHMGNLLVRARRFAEAIELLAPVEDLAREAFGREGNRPKLARYLLALGRAHAGLASPAAMATANGYLSEACSLSTAAQGPTHKDTRECTQALVDAHEAWHVAEPDDGHGKHAAEWRAKLSAIDAAYQRKE